MQKRYYIKINNQKIRVSEEIYRVYKRSQWRERKQEINFQNKTVNITKFQNSCLSQEDTIENQVINHLMISELVKHFTVDKGRKRARF